LIGTIERRVVTGSWLGYGMFLENIAVGARARGLDTCPMAAFAELPRTVRRLLGLGEDDVSVCGMAIGFEDRDAPVNRLVTERVPAVEVLEFRGFYGGACGFGEERGHRALRSGQEPSFVTRVVPRKGTLPAYLLTDIL
jgi:hypothetical protein